MAYVSPRVQERKGLTPVTQTRHSFNSSQGAAKKVLQFSFLRFLRAYFFWWGRWALSVDSGGGGESKGCRCAPTRLANDGGESTGGDPRAGSGARAWRQGRSFASRKSFGGRVRRFSFQSRPADEQRIEGRRIPVHASGGDAGSCTRFQLAGFVVRPASRSACPRRDGQDSATHVRRLVQS